MPNATDRLLRAYHSLQGLCCGDAFGERFFIPDSVAIPLIAQRSLPAPPWMFTDDTMMAISIVAILEEHGGIDQDHLASSFAKLYDSSRGYGPAMHELLRRIRHGADWRDESSALFDGQGSFGNGSAMRVAPLGAYFADDLDLAVEQARLSAVTTHCHAEAISGAIAVSLAAALACRHHESHTGRGEFLRQVLDRTPESYVHHGIQRAIDLPQAASPDHAAGVLGRGSRVSCPDTVPFALWCAARHLDSYENALWTTVSGLGDRDTTCAMVGGIVAMSAGIASIPGAWLDCSEPLPRHVLKFCHLIR